VLITADTASWIIGQMASEIIRRFSGQYEFWFFTDKILHMRPDIIRQLAPTLDFVFPLTDLGFKLLHEAMHPSAIPSLFWMHHFTNWSAEIKSAVEGAREIIVCTEDWRARLTSEARPSSPITVVPHGVDLELFRRVESRRTRFGIPNSKFVLGFVGSKRSDGDGGRKGLDTLNAVLQLCAREAKDLHIAFLGLGWGDEVRRLQAIGVSANYVGFIRRSELPEFYSAIDAYIMTSRIEGGPCTVLEAMACQTPVVATRVGLVPEAITDGETGFTAPVGDSVCLSAAVLELVRSADLRRRVGRAARISISPDRSWNAVLGRLVEPLQRMASLTSGQAARRRPLSDASVRWRKGVCAVDGLMSVLLNYKRGVVGAGTSLRMLAACWEDLEAMDVGRGLRIAMPIPYYPDAAG